LKADEFIRRFLLHVLPPRFMKTRYYGFLFHRDKYRNIALIRALMGAQTMTAAAVVEDVHQIMLRLTGTDIQCCPHCGKGQMLVRCKIPKGSRIREPP
jgi:hypothetical protein